MKRINVGLIGLGTIGTGVVKVLGENAEVIRERLGVEVFLKRIADLDITTDRGVVIPESVLTTDVAEILDDPEISIVIELIGGTTAARDFLLTALKNGKHVVTANKALISTHGRELFEAASRGGLDIGFEASVGGGIPVIKALREGLAANDIESIYGIINGTANFILTRMSNDGGRFEDILAEAQQRGYAETDPTYDVDGIDTAHKLAILASIAWGTVIDPGDIYTQGIRDITELDIMFAREFGYAIKLLAIAKNSGGEVEVRVHPTMVPEVHPLASVDGVFNAVHIHGNAVDDTMFYGRGAGMMPTASAVVADLIDIVRNIISGSHGRVSPLGYREKAPRRVRIKKMDDVETSYYLRFQAVDKPGVLSKISGLLGSHNISISSVIQKGRKRGGIVPLVILTHEAVERELNTALVEMKKLDIIDHSIVTIRIEENLGAAAE